METKRELSDLKKENRLLNRLQIRQEKELNRFQTQEGELPEILARHAEEVGRKRELCIHIHLYTCTVSLLHVCIQLNLCMVRQPPVYLQPCSSSSMRHAPVQAATSLLDSIPYYRYMYVTILARFHCNLINALFSAW